MRISIVYNGRVISSEGGDIRAGVFSDCLNMSGATKAHRAVALGNGIVRFDSPDRDALGIHPGLRAQIRIGAIPSQFGRPTRSFAIPDADSCFSGDQVFLLYPRDDHENYLDFISNATYYVRTCVEQLVGDELPDLIGIPNFYFPIWGIWEWSWQKVVLVDPLQAVFAAFPYFGINTAPIATEIVRAGDIGIASAGEHGQADEVPYWWLPLDVRYAVLIAHVAAAISMSEGRVLAIIEHPDLSHRVRKVVDAATAAVDADWILAH